MYEELLLLELMLMRESRERTDGCEPVSYTHLSQAGLAVVDLGHDTSELPLAAVLAAAVENAGIPGDLVTVLDQGDNWSYPETVRV